MTSHQAGELLDYVVLGAGPAGLQLGYYLEKRGRNYLILERADKAGSFFEKYPRSRGLISFNKVFSVYNDPEICLRWDWNSLLTEDYEYPFREHSQKIYPLADEMVEYLRGFNERFDLNIQFGCDVQTVARDAEGTYLVTTSSGHTYRTKVLVVATGASLPFVPEIEGIELAEGYEGCSFVADDYTNQRVLIIGKGNSAFELADRILSNAALIHLASPEPVELAWKTRHPGHVRAQYTSILDTYQLKTLNGALDCDILKLEKSKDRIVATVSYKHADGEIEELSYDRVIRATGFRFDATIFEESCELDLVNLGRFPAMTATWEATRSPNLFFAGTLMQAKDFKQSSSAFVDGFRYNVRTLFHLIEKRHFQKQLPGCQVPAEIESIADTILDRVCRTSSLWTQFGYLADFITISEDQSGAHFLFDLPVDVLDEEEWRAKNQVLTVTFEWGNWDGDVFAISRHPSHDTAYTNVFLHPIVRLYRFGELVSEHHILEDLFGMYRNQGESGAVVRRSGRDMETYHLEEHELPLRAYLAKELFTDHGNQAQSQTMKVSHGAKSEPREPDANLPEERLEEG